MYEEENLDTAGLGVPVVRRNFDDSTLENFEARSQDDLSAGYERFRIWGSW